MTTQALIARHHKWVIIKDRPTGNWYVRPPLCAQSVNPEPPTLTYNAGAAAIAAYQDAVTPTTVNTLTPACRSHVWRDSGACGDTWHYIDGAWHWRDASGLLKGDMMLAGDEDDVRKLYAQFAPFTRIRHA